ncbi:hypothetical protein [Bradyrhizobium sp. CCBAU 51627]|uniref:hypothetical protein n=1 Tax=Bradyrhizobium sp. CCBAU 51627 TaxID=1325088 RepID=UPI0023053254|nr:hypothetical protein [Bradyrhizobium sp. CCBAU 51627]MDA9432177.1 hypothetical protein [Bradyrhizobium sp. CCBAU 51627]
MPNYRSLVGGFFSSTPMDKTTGPVTIRMNNPGAINGAPWEKTYPGYVDTVETTPGNRSTIFEAPEFGIGAWWDLMRRYRAANVITVGGIINRYGGGQDYSAYIQFVAKTTGFTPDTTIDLNDDQQVLTFGKAMFRYEAGRPLPWSDDQVLCGIRGGRQFASSGSWPAAAAPTLSPQTQPGSLVSNNQSTSNDLLPLLQKLVLALATRPPGPPDPSTARPPGPPALPAKGTPSASPNVISPPPVLSTIDKIFGGETLTGSKTMIGVLSYALVTILKAAGVLGAATPAGQILTVLSIAFSVLGGLAKIDRMTQSISNVAANAPPKI